VPYQDPDLFDKWLNKVVGKPSELEMVVLMGLTADCCVFCTAQELSWRGYNVRLLSEGVGTYSGKKKEKEMILRNPPLTNWAEEISWNELKRLLER
jgi:nicotinamidase-related amidase